MTASRVVSPAPRPEAILFDLFGTLVFFRRASLAAGRGVPHPRLAAAVAAEIPGVGMEEFILHVREVSAELDQARRATHREFSSQERFRRVLRRLDREDEVRAARLCEAHMAGLADSTEAPEAHIDLLRRLRRQYRVGLVSNFDHGPTARSILERHQLADLLEPIVISDECGWRKPGPAIFAHALEAIGIEGARTLFVGDTPLDDIEGGHRAGLLTAWINPAGVTFPNGMKAPSITVPSVLELGESLLS